MHPQPADSGTQTAPAFGLRALQAADEAFSLAVYASTRAAEMDLLNWPGEQKDAFLRMQFEAQRQHYLLHYPRALWQVIMAQGQAAGRLIIEDADPRLVLLMDIALLAQFRGQGIGTAILSELLREAERARKSVSLHVEPNNPALRLYQRLGFVVCAQSGFYLEMKRDYLETPHSQGKHNQTQAPLKGNVVIANGVPFLGSEASNLPSSQADREIATLAHALPLPTAPAGALPSVPKRMPLANSAHPLPPPETGGEKRFLEVVCRTLCGKLPPNLREVRSCV